MSYILFDEIKKSRTERSLTAAKKWLNGNEPTKEKLEEAKELLQKFDVVPRIHLTEQQSKMYWWSLKVYNGMMILVENKSIWN